MRGSRFTIALLTVGVLTTLSVWLIARNGIAARSPGGIWNAATVCASDAQAWVTGLPVVDFLAGDGAYMARTHCMVTAEGGTDWGWVWFLVGLNVLVIVGYLRIFVFWRRAYLQEEAQDRNTKLMDLAWIFLLCASCGYISSIMLFFWPGYRLLALALCPLVFFTWKFAANLEGFRLSLSAKRLARQLNESLQQQNQRLSEEVAIATRELRAARDEAERANEAKGEFLARMSHEIRTPLTAIVGFLDLAQEDLETGRGDHIEVAKRNSKYLLRLVNDVLDVSKIEAGEMAYEIVPCSITEIIRGVVELLSPKAELMGTSMRFEIEDTIPGLIKTDPTRVRQMILNLVGNAIKFTRDGEIRVCVEGLRDRHDAFCGLRISVNDTGIGMTAEQASRVFEKFNQADNDTSRRFGGTGLGLTISRQIARALGGDVTVTSEPGMGSEFVATMMCSAYTAGAPFAGDSSSGQAPQSVSPVDTLRGRRILLVEDTADNVMLIGHHFRKIGVELETACNGEVGMTRVLEAEGEGRGYDLVLMDINMPVMDGIESLTLIRDAGCCVPVIMLSAHALLDEQRRCYDLGASDYCTKPIDFAELFEVCAMHTAGTPRRHAA